MENENRGLKEKINVKENLVHRAEVYFLKKEDGEDGPFCTKCYDTQSFLVRMTDWDQDLKRCPNCGKVYKTK